MEIDKINLKYFFSLLNYCETLSKLYFKFYVPKKKRGMQFYSVIIITFYLFRQNNYVGYR